MIAGTVTDEGEPRVELPVAGRSWSAVIDTGFNGDLELPEALRPFVNAHFRARLAWILAGGRLVEEDTYSVDFPFDGQVVFAEASFVEEETILVGTGLLRAYRLIVDFPAQTVLLERGP